MWKDQGDNAYEIAGKSKKGLNEYIKKLKVSKFIESKLRDTEKYFIETKNNE